MQNTISPTEVKLKAVIITYEKLCSLTNSKIMWVTRIGVYRSSTKTTCVQSLKYWQLAAGMRVNRKPYS